jgi:hypothetical protein
MLSDFGDAIHPFLLCIYEVVHLDYVVFIAVDYPDLGDIRELVRIRGAFPEANA